jgi:hypothetical protein
MMRAICDFIWPTLSRITAFEENENAALESEQIKKIDSVVIEADHLSIASEVAKGIYRQEEARVTSSEAKSFYLLLVTAALVPILTYLESAIWENKFGTAPKWLSIGILLIASGYLVGAAFWAIRTVSVRTYHTIGASDFADIWNSKSPLAKLTKDTLAAAIKNQSVVNSKVSSVNMAIKLLLRAIVAFSALLFVEGFWEIGVPLLPKLRAALCGG